jgi:predicted lipoprotein with Yx(FWY)xxD motif
MAYDPNDPADKRIVDKLIKDAVDAALEEARTEHEAEVEGLRNKRTELLDKLKKARAGEGGGDTAEIDRLENELETVKGELRTATANLRQAKRDIETVTAERDTARQTAETEGTFARDLVIENGLTAALTEANVAPQFMPAAVALLKGQVEVKADDKGKRQAFASDKPLGEFVKEWAQGDQGKHYVAAPNNSGGGSGGAGQGGGSAKKISEMSESERISHFNAIGKDAFEAQVQRESKPA